MLHKKKSIILWSLFGLFFVVAYCGDMYADDRHKDQNNSSEHSFAVDVPFDSYLGETFQEEICAQTIVVQKPSFIQQQLIRFVLPLYFKYAALKHYIGNAWKKFKERRRRSSAS